MEGKLLVFSGPSGVGKGSILNELLTRKNYSFSVSMTTRSPRPGEVDGVSYYFVSQEKFDQTIEEGGFLEYVHKFEKSYGTPKKPILDMMAAGKNVILDIEMEGAFNVKKLFPKTMLIFILPPDLKTLHDRLEGRGSETQEQIEIRQKDIQKEIAQIVNYDYYVVNDTIKAAADTIDLIVSGKGENYKIVNPQELINKYKEK